MNPPAPQLSSVADPLHAVRRLTLLAWCTAIPALALVAIWAFHPLQPASTAPPAIEPRRQLINPGPDAAPLPDPRAFAIRLWNPVPPQNAQTSAAVTAAPPPPPLNVQLIGIITEGPGGTAKAALYDADQDRLLIVADGERVRDQTVRILAGGIVELTDGRATRRLMLRAAKGATGS